MGNQGSNTGNNIGNNQDNNNNLNSSNMISQLQQQILNNQLEIQRMQIESMRNQTSNAFSNPMLTNPNLHRDMANDPSLKGKFLRFILNEFKNQMNQQQINRINLMLQQLPPERNNVSMPLMPQPASSQLRSERQLVSLQQNNNVGIMSRQYETEDEKAQREFELEEKRRKQAFQEAQEQRRREYQAKLSQLKNENINSMKLFSLERGYTLDQLKISYKRLALKTHPDKGGSKEKFELVTKCYFSLLEDLKKQEQDKQFFDLKKGSDEYIKTQNSTSQRFTLSKDYASISKDSFNLRKFNKIFEEHKLYDPDDEGYEEWFRNNENKSTDIPKIFSDKFNIQVFNSTFKDNVKNQTSDIVEYKEPSAIVSADKLEFSELGGTGKDDFGRNNQYTDLKKAYTTQSTFINSNLKARKSYRTIDDYERERADVSYEMTPEQIARAEIEKREEEILEQDRLERLRRHDNLTAKHYSKVHQSMLGYQSNPDMNR